LLKLRYNNRKGLINIANINTITRKNLSRLLGKMVTVEGTALKFGTTRNTQKKPTLLLKNVTVIRKDKTFHVEHLWIKLSGKMLKKDLTIGSKVSFEGTIFKYRKHEMDFIHSIYSYGVNDIKKFLVVEEGDGEHVFDFLSKLI